MIGPDPFPAIALARARSAEVARLFETLVARAAALARQQEAATAEFARRRAAREGRPAELSRRQKKLLVEFEQDAEQARRKLERLADEMDDAALVSAALAGIRQQIDLDEQLFSDLHADDRPLAEELLAYQRETLGLIETFLASSPLRDQVDPMW